MIDRIPVCLQTCLHCAYAVVLEEYSAYDRRLVFDGCWKRENIPVPIGRGECGKFKESEERIKRKFWKKWEEKVYTTERVRIKDHFDEVQTDEVTTNDQPEDIITQEPFKTADEVTTKQGIDTGSVTAEHSKTSRTRALILQALANNISHLNDISHFAGVDPSTAHYHLRNLIKEERVLRVSWGEYVLPGQFKNDGRNFENLLKNFSQLVPGVESCGGFYPVEKNILMDVLSKENKYEQYSERELARKSKVSRYKVKKYTRELEKKRLIEIRKEGNRLVFVPTKVAIHGLTDFFASIKNGSKFNSSSSKFQPLSQPPNSKIQPTEEFQDEGHTADSRIQPGELEMFDDFLTWQQKNAHRIILQFKVLRCDHSRLKRTGWIFGKKAIRKHFPEAYIFKSKDPSGEIVNILPKEPFIFMSPFEFQDQIVGFVNEIVERLKDCGIYLDLSEPAEVKMEHVALENDVFARNVVKKGLLYFRSVIHTVDSTGETMEYVIAIDKSKALHLEFQGTEAEHLAEEYEAFIDDVVSKRIDRKVLRDMPEKLQDVQSELTQKLGEVEETFSTSIQEIKDTQKLLHENQLGFSEDLASHAKIVRKMSETAESFQRAADSFKEAVELFMGAEKGS